MELKLQCGCVYIKLGASQPVGDAQIRVVQRVGLHQAGGGKVLVEKRPFGLGKSTHLL